MLPDPNDPTPPKPYVWIGVQDGEGSENAANNDTITFIVGRWGYWSSPLTVQLFAPAGTATAADFTSAMPTSVAIPPGGATATTTFTITPADDDLVEEEESIYAILKGSDSYWLSTAFMAAGAIAANDDVSGDIAVMKMNHNAPNGELPQAEETNPGALLPVNSDDDDYDAQNLADRSQVTGANQPLVQGEDDVLPIVLKAAQPAVGKYRLVTRHEEPCP
ncbi:hypothetical protein [Fontivita pretiosa]|uniref:hypothetical protein n=1 Tax=Fontivita pretiosa TaxID=2989684 RepID=UPI003D178224